MLFLKKKKKNSFMLIGAIGNLKKTTTTA